MELPKTKIKPKALDPRTLLIYGSPKIGKTTILSGLPSNLILDLEEGSEFVEALKIKVSNFKELVEIGKMIIAEKYPYKFTTTDTITQLEDWCHDYALMKYKNSTQGKSFKGTTLQELDFGLGYGLWREEFKGWIGKLKKLSEYKIFIGHVKDKMITKNQAEVAVKDINLTGQIKAIATSDVDAVGYLYLDPEDSTKRRISFLTSDEIVCGNRCPHLEGQDFIISEKLESGEIITHWNKIYQSLK